MTDLHVLLLALGAGNLSFAVLMALYTAGATRRPGLRRWMWARLMMGSSQLIGWAHPSFAGTWLVDIEPIGWVAGLALETAAYCAFLECRCWQRLLGPVSAVAILLAIAASITGASRAQMTTLVSIVVALFAVVMGVMLLRPRRSGSSLLQKLIGLNDLVFAGAMTMCAWTGTVHGEQGLPTTPLEAFVFLSNYLIMIVNGFGFLLLCKQKDDAQMERLATIDFLTGLVNRRAFFEHADSARLLANRLRKPVSLMMLDIDHFKQLNDRFGHASGDEALALFADTARQTLREHDIMGRLGGEEFALVLPGTDLDGALQAAERLRVAVNETPLNASGNDYAMTVSIGVALIDPREELATALARADCALYAAKTGGRNRVEAAAALPRRVRA